MSSGPPLLQRIARALLRPLSALCDRLGNRFYVGLAVLVIAVATAAIVTGNTGAMKNRAYDLIMKARLAAPAAATDIIILDIDEAALAAMAKEYGRWPWPRTIMGELIEGMASQKPKAIVFDIAFSDPDLFNADADKFFREAVARNPNTYFPMIRLVPENDPRSALRVKQLTGVRPMPDEQASPDATIAVVLPYFADVLTDARLGTSNILTDDDGIVRTYSVYADEYGWRVGSLPANVVQALGIELPDATEILLNWRGRPLSYHHVSFHEVYLDLLKQQRARPADEFTNKIVIIGSTAPALFDYKPTSVAKVHPGVEILATALDNLRRGDALRELPRWATALITAVAVLLLAFAFVYNIDQRVITLTFTILQTGFLVVSYAFLNFWTLFIDLTAPFTFCLLYFTAARFNGMLSAFRRSGHPFFSDLLDEGNECRVILLECRLHLREHNPRLRLGVALKEIAGRTSFGVVTPPLFKGIPLLHAFVHDSLVFYWSVPRAREREALEDLLTMLERVVAVSDRVARRRGDESAVATLAVHSTVMRIDANDAWRDIGQRALAELLQQGPTDRGNQAVRILASGEFSRWCRSEAGPIAPALAAAGLG